MRLLPRSMSGQLLACLLGAVVLAHLGAFGVKLLLAEEGSPWWHPLYFSIPVSILPVLLVVPPFLRRTLRPIRALELAAERISRGEHGEALPVTGPREARELTMAFKLMVQRQQRFVAERTRMLAAISHDLRTPLTALRLRVEMVEDGELREAMTNTLRAMTLMVEETLNFSAADTQSQAAQEADLAALAREVAADLARPGLALRWSGPASLPYRCRPLAIRRALANLGENAARHAAAVEIRGRRGAGGEVIMEVLDNGPGIDPAVAEGLFAPFVRLEPSRNRGTGGVGLGLGIARNCVEAHGGRLSLANRPEGGLAATILLPPA